MSAEFAQACDFKFATLKWFILCQDLVLSSVTTDSEVHRYHVHGIVLVTVVLRSTHNCSRASSLENTCTSDAYTARNKPPDCPRLRHPLARIGIHQHADLGANVACRTLDCTNQDHILSEA